VRPWALAVLAAALLAGCAGTPAPDVPGPAAPPDTVSVAGAVHDETLAPVAGATVSIRMADRSTVTDASGAFRFDGLARSAYLVDASAEGFVPATLLAEPDGSGASLAFVLERVPSQRPAVAVEHFRGILRCALEALIISPSCDAAIEAAGGDPVFDDVSAFDLPVGPGWRALVVDVDFDPGAHPGIDGLRLAARGASDPGEAGQYEQFGRFNGSEPFTVLLRPGAEYPGGSGPIPATTSLFHFDVYPHSHGWHPGGLGVLGVGAGVDVAFDVYATVFYNQEAPAGYTLLGGA
jgi:hypothetical protein